MLAETFLRQFAPLVSSTNGIQKLRELVLQLAVRGKLVPQKTSDGHASDAAKKALQNVPDKIKRQLGDAGQPHPIPENWVWVTLGAISNYGETDKVDPGTIDDPDFWILELEDIEKSTSRLLARVPFQERNFRSSKNRFKEGQVLYGKLRPYLDKVIVADRDGCCTPEIVPFSVFGGIDPYFIRWCMKTPAFISYADGSTYGMNLPRMGTKSAIAAPIPLPPIAEQKRIVAKVNELMALCDELEAQQAKETELKRATAASTLHHLIEAKTPEETTGRWSLLGSGFSELFDDLETIKALRGTILHAAAFGRLTEQLSTDGSASELLDKINAQRSKMLAKNLPSKNEAATQARKLENQCIPDALPELPANWQWATLMQCCRWVVDCRNKTAQYSAAGATLLRTNNIRDGKLRLTDVKFVDDETYAKWTERYRPAANDLVITREAPMGEVCLLDNRYTYCLGQRLMLASMIPGTFEPKFLLYSLRDPELMNRVQDKPVGSTVQHFRVGGIETLLVPVPPLAEQKRIVVKVDELMALCDRLEEQVREGERLSAELMASLVQVLTETDPDGGGAAAPVNAPTNIPPQQTHMNAPQTPAIKKSARAAFKPNPETSRTPDSAPSVDTKFKEAVLVATIVNTFLQAGGEPIGNFRLQKAVYFARRRMGEHVGEMAYLKKAAGPYNPSMKYSGGIAIAKQKNWLREARGRFGFGHVPGADIGDAGEWIETYHYDSPARWVAEQFRYKKNEEWETLATVDYAIEHLQTLSIEPDAAQILQYIASDPEWRPKVEKLRLTEMSVATAMLEVQALFGAEGGDKRA